MPVETSYRQSLTGHEMERAAWPWLADLRLRAHQRFETLGFPSRGSEAWKYIPLEPLLGASFVGAEPAQVFDAGLLAPLVPADENRLVFVNGAYSDSLSNTAFLPHGVFLGRLEENIKSTPGLVEPYLGSRLEAETNAFSLINTFSFRDGAFIVIPEGVELDRPLHVIFASVSAAGRPPVIYPRVLLLLG